MTYMWVVLISNHVQSQFSQNPGPADMSTIDFAYCGIYLFSSSSSNKRSWHQTDHLCGPFNLLHPTFHFPCPSLETTTICLWWLGSTLVCYGNVTLISFGTAFLAKESDKMFVSLSHTKVFINHVLSHAS